MTEGSEAGSVESDLVAGVRALAGGDLATAATTFHRVLTLQPLQHDALHYLGVIAFQTGQIEKAVDLIAAAIKVNPDNADAQSNYGSVLLADNRLHEAEHALRRAIALNPESATFHFNLGNVLARQTRLQEAKASYKDALSRRPDYPEALCNLGTVYRDLENLASATTCYEKALAARPAYAEAAYNLANAYRDAGRLSDAERLIRRAITLNPDNAKAHNSLGNILSESARSDEAIDAFKSAAALDPHSLPMASNVLSCMQYVIGIDDAALKSAHEAWVRQFALLFSQPTPLNVDRSIHRPLRIGFVSPDFGRHPCGFLSVRMFEALDPGRIKPVIFSTRRLAREDDVSKRIAAVTDWRRVEAMTDAELVSDIVGANIDILIDMSGHTSGHRLSIFARKPAPIQMSWLGYVGSTGLPTMDYIIADRWHMPTAHIVAGPEKALRLTDGYVCFDPAEDMGEVTPLPAQKNGFVTFGGLNNATKLNAQVFESYAAILNQVPRSKLILAFRGLNDPIIARSIRAHFEAQGITADRIDIRGYAKRHKFLAIYNEIDLALDTFPYSGGLTTCEALWMGVPVVTFPGQTFAGRHSTSHMSNAGLADFVAADRQAFESLAVAKAQDINALAQLRAGLRAKISSSPLCVGPRFAASFAEAMSAAWATYCASR